MICEPCRWEADHVKDDCTTHAKIVEVIEMFDGPIGHAACPGDCGCQHRPVGSVLFQ